jgi:hypothetical protein
MIPSFLKKYAKKWGAEVGTTEIKGMAEPKVEYQGPDKTMKDLDEASSDYSVHSQPFKLIVEIRDDMRRGVPFKDAISGALVSGVQGVENLAEKLGGKFLKTPANQKVHSIEITPAMRQSVMKEGQPIAKKDDKKKPFAAPEQNMEAANFKQRLSDKMTAALA